MWMCTISTGFEVGLLLVKTEQMHPIEIKRSRNTTYHLNLEIWNKTRYKIFFIDFGLLGLTLLLLPVLCSENEKEKN